MAYTSLYNSPVGKILVASKSYAGGIDKKIKLLELEKVDMSNFYIPIKKY